MVRTHLKNFNKEECVDDLELREVDGRLTLAGVYVDFNDIEMRLIKKSARNSNQPVMKAIGKQSEYIIDLTCGYGKDSYLFLCSGRRVKGLERNPKVFRLLRDGLERAKMEEVHEELSRFDLLQAEARDFVSSLTPDQYPDAFYIDPMYPPRSRSALPKKDIQVLRRLLNDEIGEDPETREANLRKLIELCLEKTRKRVVLKRPVWLEPLSEPKISFEGKLVRYDVYVKE